jgi:hypothetical protein
MKKARQQTFETYNHRILWEAAKKNLRLATPSNDDAKFFSLGAMFLFFAAFEGYLNWLGTRVAPKVWKEERKFFFHTPYRGTLGKYQFLAKMLWLPDPDPSKGPFQTANHLLELRNKVAHPKPEAGERSVNVEDGYFPEHYQSDLAKEVSPDAANRAKDDLEKLAEELHCKAKQAYPSNIHESGAFVEVLATETTDA